MVCCLHRQGGAHASGPGRCCRQRTHRVQPGLLQPRGALEPAPQPARARGRAQEAQRLLKAQLAHAGLGPAAQGGAGRVGGEGGWARACNRWAQGSACSGGSTGERMHQARGCNMGAQVRGCKMWAQEAQRFLPRHGKGTRVVGRGGWGQVKPATGEHHPASHGPASLPAGESQEATEQLAGAAPPASSIFLHTSTLCARRTHPRAIVRADSWACSTCGSCVISFPRASIIRAAWASPTFSTPCAAGRIAHAEFHAQACLMPRG